MKRFDVEALIVDVVLAISVLQLLHRTEASLCLEVHARVDALDTLGGQVVMRWHLPSHLLPCLNQNVLLLVDKYEIGEQFNCFRFEQICEGVILQVFQNEVHRGQVVLLLHPIGYLRTNESRLDVAVFELVVVDGQLILHQVRFRILIAVIQVNLNGLGLNLLHFESLFLLLQVGYLHDATVCPPRLRQNTLLLLRAVDRVLCWERGLGL